MADISNTERTGGAGNKPRSRKQSLRVDLTPMVDLAFLLISFFMLTVVITESRQMDLTMPNGDVTAPIGDCQVLHVLIDSADRIYTYEGLAIEDIKETSLNPDAGIRHVLMGKARQVRASCPSDISGNPRQMVCLIKLLSGSHYSSMVNILDEMEITGVKVYALQEPSAEEVKAVISTGQLAKTRY